jgi:hypothetical protein
LLYAADFCCYIGKIVIVKIVVVISRRSLLLYAADFCCYIGKIVIVKIVVVISRRMLLLRLLLVYREDCYC